MPRTELLASANPNGGAQVSGPGGEVVDRCELALSPWLARARLSRQRAWEPKSSAARAMVARGYDVGGDEVDEAGADVDPGQATDDNGPGEHVGVPHGGENRSGKADGVRCPPQSPR